MSEKHGLEQLNRIPVAEAVVRNAIPCNDCDADGVGL